MATVAKIGDVAKHERKATSRMGERGAVGLKSGDSVANSEPVLRRPGTPSTADRKPAARPPASQRCAVSPATQPQSWQGFGDRVPEEIARERISASGLQPETSVGRAASALETNDTDSISQLRAFFELLDRWDREVANATKTV